MAYNCILYKNTGFNVVNIPDSPALLASVGNPINVPALDIVQDRFLQTVRVHATYSQVMDVDYAQIGDFYYMVTGIHMLNGDTCQLTLVPDFLTSAGGVADIDFIDGMTERVHVSNDTYGKYTEHDELMTPAEPLQIVIDYHVKPSGSGSDEQFAEATIDLKNNTGTDAKTYTDPATGDSVTVPQNAVLSGVTNFEMYAGSGITHTNRTGVFDLTDPDVVDGIQRARDLGTESAIIAQWRVPAIYCAVTTGTAEHTTIAGQDLDYEAVDLPYEYAQNVNNLKILYSDFTKYGIMTMAGDKAEFNPTDIYDSQYTHPHVRCMTDPRADGKPYFRYQTYKGDDSIQGFFMNCVGGAEWEQVPLLYQGKSGNELNRLQFEADRAEKWGKFKGEALGGILGEALSAAAAFGTAMSMTGGTLGSVIPGAGTLAGMGIGAAVGAGVGAVVGGVQAASDYFRYKEEAQRELQKYAYSNLVTAPQLQVPYNAKYIRDVLRNGAVCYRFLYSQNDVQRIDKLLTMYGYKHAKVLEASDFTSRQDFNYVSAHGVEVTGNNNNPLPRWWCEGIAAQLEAGMRVWHVAPDPTLYS